MDWKYNLDNRSVLFKVANEVPYEESVLEILDLMNIAIKKSSIVALGLAAPQIGIQKRIIVINTPSLQAVIINPKIIRKNLGTAPSIESCLSFPGLTKKRTRYKQIVVTGFDSDWVPIKLKLRGLQAIVVQHEVDHLNGITIGEESC